MNDGLLGSDNNFHYSSFESYGIIVTNGRKEITKNGFPGSRGKKMGIIIIDELEVVEAYFMLVIKKHLPPITLRPDEAAIPLSIGVSPTNSVTGGASTMNLS